MSEILTDVSINDVISASAISINTSNNISYNSEEFPVDFDEKKNILLFECPHCKIFVEVSTNEINCAIFRHGYFFEKDQNGNIMLTSQIPPHSSKQICDSLFNEGKIIGCGKPFKIERKSDKYIVKICDYI